MSFGFPESLFCASRQKSADADPYFLALPFEVSLTHHGEHFFSPHPLLCQLCPPHPPFQWPAPPHLCPPLFQALQAWSQVGGLHYSLLISQEVLRYFFSLT